MGNGNFVGMFMHYFSWVWKEIVFHWVRYKFGSLSDEFMEMKDFWVDWGIVGCCRI